MLVHSQRLTAACLALALMGLTPWSLCAGWSPAPEARMACCSDAEGCAMHGGDDGDAGPQRTLTQDEADACCAVSEGDRPVPSPAPFVLMVAFAALPGPAPLHGAASPDIPISRTDAPVVAPEIPRHVLLSVFLV